MASSSIRYQLFLPRPLAERFEALAAAPGTSKSRLLATAVEAWLDRQGFDALELSRNPVEPHREALLERIERNGHVELESLALFVRYMLTVTPPVADEDDAARAVGRDRFAAFVERVGRRLAGGRLALLPEEDGR